MEVDYLIGERLAAARKDVQLSQRALAAELGVTLRTVQNYESGKFVPYRHLPKLSTLVGRSSSWLLFGADSPDAEQLVAKLHRQRNELFENLDRLVELRDKLATLRDKLAAVTEASQHLTQSRKPAR